MAQDDSPTPPAAPVKLGKRPKAEKVLPTDRIAFTKQMELLRAYGQLGRDGGSVTNASAAEVVGLHSSTTSLANTFFVDVGFVARTPDGQVPSAAVIQFARAYDFDADTAPHKLAPLVRTMWFANALLPKVRFRAYTEKDAIGVLADAAGAAVDHKLQLETLLSLLEYVGLVTIENGSVKARLQADDEVSKTAPVAAQPEQATTQPVRQSGSAGAFEFSMSVTLADIGQLPADKIVAFMGAITEMMKIKAELERSGGSK